MKVYFERWRQYSTRMSFCQDVRLGTLAFRKRCTDFMNEAFVWVCGAFVAQKQVLHEHNRGSEFSRTSRRRDKLLVQRQQLGD